MKKSVKKVLAALLSVLLFASLFTTTAFAAAPGQADVDAAKKELNAALDKFYGGLAVFNSGDLQEYVYHVYVDKAAQAIAANLIKNYPAIAAMIANGIDPAKALEAFSVALNYGYQQLGIYMVNEAIAENLSNQAAAIDKAADAYAANLQKFVDNIDAMVANIGK